MSSGDEAVATSNRRGLANIARRWPAVLGILLAAATGLGLTDGRDVAPVVAASAFVYLAAAAVGRKEAAWPAFGGTFVLIGLGKVLEGFDPVPWMCAAAVVLLVIGLATGGWRPMWSLPAQAAAMMLLGAVAAIALRVEPTLGGVLVSLGLLAHAAWDVYHHRTGRVVSRSLAEFCAVLDVVLGGGLLVLILVG